MAEFGPEKARHERGTINTWANKSTLFWAHTGSELAAVGQERDDCGKPGHQMVHWAQFGSGLGKTTHVTGCLCKNSEWKSTYGTPGAGTLQSCGGGRNFNAKDPGGWSPMP